MHTIKITPNLGLLFEYQCTSGKLIRLPNRIEKKIDRRGSNRIETFFCSNWNALLAMTLCLSVTSRCSIETVERFELVLTFWHVSFLPPVLHCVKRKFGYLQK